MQQLQALQAKQGLGMVDFGSYADGVFDFFGTSNLTFQFPGERVFAGHVGKAISEMT